MTSESARLKERGAASWAAAVAHPMVAEIGAEKVRQSEVDKAVQQELARIDRDADKQRFDTRRQALVATATQPSRAVSREADPASFFRGLEAEAGLGSRWEP